MKRFILNISVLLILVALLSSSVFASDIMPLYDGALDVAYVEMEENQYNSILSAIETLAEVPSSLKSGWSSSYPSGFSSSWYYKVITLLDDLQSTDLSFLNSGWSYSYPSTYGSSWYYRVVSEIENLQTPLSSLSSTVNNGWSNMISYLVNLPLILEDTTSLETHLDLFYTSYQNDIKSLKTDLGLSVLRLDDIRSDFGSFYNYFKAEVPYRLETQLLYLESITGNIAGIRDYVYFIMEEVMSKPFEDEIKETQLDEREALADVLSSDSRVDDIGSVFSLKNDFSAFFAVDGADVSQVFSQIEEGSSQWFSQSTADALSVGGGVSVASSDDPVSDTPLLDQRMSEIASYFTGGE